MSKRQPRQAKSGKRVIQVASIRLIKRDWMVRDGRLRHYQWPVKLAQCLVKLGNAVTPIILKPDSRLYRFAPLLLCVPGSRIIWVMTQHL